MQDHVDQSEFENLDEDQIMQGNDFDYSSVRNRSRSPRERNTWNRQGEQSIPKMKESLEEVQDLLGA